MICSITHIGMRVERQKKKFLYSVSSARKCGRLSRTRDLRIYICEQLSFLLFKHYHYYYYYNYYNGRSAMCTRNVCETAEIVLKQNNKNNIKIYRENFSHTHHTLAHCLIVFSHPSEKYFVCLSHCVDWPLMMMMRNHI
jgi:hypothetical protein